MGRYQFTGWCRLGALNQIPDEHCAQWRQAAAALIEAAIPADTKSPDTWPVRATLLPHAQKTLTDHSVGMARIASYLGHSGSHTAARNLQRRIAEARAQELGPEHPDTLTALASLAHWTGQAGDPAGARDHLDRLAQPLQLTRGHYAGNVTAVGDYRDRPAIPGPAHDLRPGRLVLGTYGDRRFAHVSMMGGRPGSRRGAPGP